MMPEHSSSKTFYTTFNRIFFMYYFIDLCCGLGSMTKAFEKTGAYQCVLAADSDINMRNMFSLLFQGRMPLGTVESDQTRLGIRKSVYDLLLCSTIGVEEDTSYKVLEIIEEEQPKAFVYELGADAKDQGFYNVLRKFCKDHDYIFLNKDKNFAESIMNLDNFGIPEFCERVFVVGIKPEWCRWEEQDNPTLNFSHDFRCYQYGEYNPDKNPEQRKGLDWGFYRFMFLHGTNKEQKQEIIERTTPLPMAASVALDLLTYLI